MENCQLLFMYSFSSNPSIVFFWSYLIKTLHSLSHLANVPSFIYISMFFFLCVLGMRQFLTLSSNSQISSSIVSSLQFTPVELVSWLYFLLVRFLSRFYICFISPCFCFVISYPFHDVTGYISFSILNIRILKCQTGIQNLILCAGNTCSAKRSWHILKC